MVPLLHLIAVNTQTTTSFTTDTNAFQVILYPPTHLRNNKPRTSITTVPVRWRLLWRDGYNWTECFLLPFQKQLSFCNWYRVQKGLCLGRCLWLWLVWGYDWI